MDSILQRLLGAVVAQAGFRPTLGGRIDRVAATPEAGSYLQLVRHGETLAGSPESIQRPRSAMGSQWREYWRRIWG